MEVVVYLYGKTDFVNALRDCANGCNVMFGHNMFFYITNCLPDINFPFSIFNFTFNNSRSGIKCYLLVKLSSRMINNKFLDFEHIAVHNLICTAEFAVNFGGNALVNVQTVDTEISRTADITDIVVANHN